MSHIQEVPGAFDAPPPPLDALEADPKAAPITGNAPPAAAEGNFALPNLNRAIGKQISGPIELLKDVDLNVKIELGRTRMLIEDVLRLGEGSVVELDKLAGDPVDVFVNEQLVARGEVLVLNDNFCVRINEIVTATEE
jgi:flagellar motor switch protein FliN